MNDRFPRSISIWRLVIVLVRELTFIIFGWLALPLTIGWLGPNADPERAVMVGIATACSVTAVRAVGSAIRLRFENATENVTSLELLCLFLLMAEESFAIAVFVASQDPKPNKAGVLLPNVVLLCVCYLAARIGQEIIRQRRAIDGLSD